MLYFFSQFSESGILAKIPSNMGFLGVSDGKQSACNAGDPGLIPGSGRSSGEGNGNPLLPGKSHGWKSLVGYSPCGHEDSDTTERLYFFNHW